MIVPRTIYFTNTNRADVCQMFDNFSDDTAIVSIDGVFRYQRKNHYHIIEYDEVA